MCTVLFNLKYVRLIQWWNNAWWLLSLYEKRNWHKQNPLANEVQYDHSTLISQQPSIFPPPNTKNQFTFPSSEYTHTHIHIHTIEWKDIWTKTLHSVIYLLTPWCRVLLEKLTGLQLVKKFPAFNWTRRFITVLTRVRHLSLSWANPIQSTYPHPTSWRSILILPTHLRLGLPSGLFPSGFPTKTLYAPLSPHTRHMPCPSHSSRFYHPYNIGWGVQII